MVRTTEVVLAYLNVAAICTGRNYADKCNSKLSYVWYFVVTISKNYKKGLCIKLFVETNINPLKPELNPICYLLALLGAHHFLHVSRIRVK